MIYDNICWLYQLGPLFLKQFKVWARAQIGETEALPICTPSTVASLPDFVRC